MFSGPVEDVSWTRIFARGEENGRQSLVYSMDVTTAEPVAMILPIPVPAGSAEDAVEFIDLSRYRDFFDDLDQTFAIREHKTMMGGGGLAPPAPAWRPPLEVRRVGSFDASFVPSLADFDRLDERFRLPQDVWDQFPEHRDYGFAVFKLAPKRSFFGFGRLRSQTIHPMAFSFPRRDPSTLFFPTLHVHDGVAHSKADFDHKLYCQPDLPIAQTVPWERSERSPRGVVKLARAKGVIDGSRPIYRKNFYGQLPNEDVVLRAPVFSNPSALTGSGPLFRFQLRASSAYYMDRSSFGGARRRTALTQLDALHDVLLDGLQTVTSGHEQQWGLRSLEADLPEYCSRGGRLYDEFTSLSWSDPPPTAGPVTIRFEVESDRIERQDIWLCFSSWPDSTTCASVSFRILEILQRLPEPAE